jgi:hypothetical protein
LNTLNLVGFFSRFAACPVEVSHALSVARVTKTPFRIE